MKYKNAPIQEAVFDIKVSNLSNYTIDDIDKIHTQILDKYPTKKKKINFSGQLQIGEEKQSINKPNTNIIGLVFLQSDESRQVQFRLDGFTFNMIGNYTSWKDFSEEAFRLFEIYNSAFNPKSIIRIGVRYINRIPLKIPFGDFDDYIKNMPPIPKCLPQSFNNFLMQITVPCHKNLTTAVVSETMDIIKDDVLPFILDIDVFKYDLNGILNTPENLRNEFDEIRIIKNDIFEDIITDKVRAIFNHEG